ncbi:MAG: peptidase M22 [Acutalibacteraceae bacterium]|nr:peptidase M22 [Acutalibacteraceae bacterium]
MGLYVGFDTSNYTTSVSVFDSENNTVNNCKKLLPVDIGEKGLMQSKALFEHIRQLPEVTEAAFSPFSRLNISAVGVSDKPRNIKGSYMPVFLAGVNCATAVALSNGVKLHKTSHQVGHILSALYSSNRLDLINRQFIAFHISGGTTEALLVSPDKEEIIKCEREADSLDLKAGQAIDRVGVMLGLKFPAGAELDRLSQSGISPIKPKPVLKGVNCSISGVENKAMKLFENGEKKENIARFTIEFILNTVLQMTEKLKQQYGDIPFVYSGGVMSNSLIRQELSKSGGIFCEPQFSSDNATGIAIYAYLKEKAGV